jgi:hypothetical protein
MNFKSLYYTDFSNHLSLLPSELQILSHLLGFRSQPCCSFNVRPTLSYPVPGLDRSLGLHEFETPRTSRQSAHEGIKVVISRLQPPLFPGVTLSTHFCGRLSRTQDHSAAGIIKLVKHFIELIGNRTRDLPACGAVPQHSHHRELPHPYTIAGEIVYAW